MKWEYHLVPLPGELNKTTILDHLNKLGTDGWELVSVDNGIAYFKRATESDTGMSEKEFNSKLIESIRRMI